MDDGMLRARDILRRWFGYPEFRPGQVDVIASVLSGRDTLAVLPTGGGKSLCYQVPALALPGLTVVISPLISLMKDQVDRLVGRGVAAALLNSTLEPRDVASRLRDAERGAVKLLYVAPERFEAADLRRSLSRCTLSLLAVDEAHCISEWGHDFRPSFRHIATVAAALRVRQVVALTATATPAVRRDIARQLRLRDPRVIVGGFDRVNLRYAVRSCRGEPEKEAALLDILHAHERPAIVYAASRSAVERAARRLARAGVRAVPYHAGLDAGHRRQTQDTFMAGGADTIVATNAFGMGIDKPDVRLVVHYAMSGSLEAYYQEAGRAGRDGRPSFCLLLHAREDRCTHEWFIAGMYPSRAAVERVYDALRRAADDGHPLAAPPGREAAAAVRLLLRYHALEDRRGTGTSMFVRLLATPRRIARELAGGAGETDGSLRVLRALWRDHGRGLWEGCTIDVDQLCTGTSRRTLRATLETLRDRQFVDFQWLDAGLHVVARDRPLEHFDIAWDALARRRAADVAKLDAMQGYARTRRCRRAFVLRYFGELHVSRNCGACDNCLRS